MYPSAYDVMNSNLYDINNYSLICSCAGSEKGQHAGVSGGSQSCCIAFDVASLILRGTVCIVL